MMSPYFNLEKYECGCFGSREEFDEFINCLFEVFNKSNAKIREHITYISNLDTAYKRIETTAKKQLVKVIISLS